MSSTLHDEPSSWRDAAWGANYARLWMPSWDMGLVYAPATLEDWSARMDRAWRLDRVFELAEEHGIHLMLSLQNHGPFALGGFFAVVAIGSVVLAILRLRSVKSGAGMLVTEVRSLIGGDQRSERTVIETVESSDGVQDEGVVVMSRQFFSMKDAVGGPHRSVPDADVGTQCRHQLPRPHRAGHRGITQFIAGALQGGG